MNAETLGQVSVLAEARRRRMYFFIRERRRPVSRDEAAGAVGISRKLAAFHLDKLVDTGLLKAHYARPAGRGGPGAGRTSKLYEPTDVEVEISLPERHYDIPAAILLEAVESRRPGEDPGDAAARVAAGRGRALGKSLRSHLSARGRDVARDVLRDHGFEPYDDPDGTVRLHNCPFLRLAQRSPGIVCGMNMAFVDGFLRGLGERKRKAILDPRPTDCCVALRESTASS